MGWRDKIEKPQDQRVTGWRAKAESVRQEIEAADKRAGFFNTSMYEPANVSSWQRFVAKVFAANPNKAAAYIKSKNPDLEVDVFNDEVVVRKKGETNFKPIDPNTLEPADLAELVPDILAGGLQGLATTAAAVPAALATGGVAALPAASVASALSGAGVEALRMGAGSALGIPDNIEGSNIISAGGFGATQPFFFGVDKLPESVKQSGRGAIKRLIDKAGPTLTEFFTNIDPSTQAYFRANKDKIKEIYEGGGDRQLVQIGGEKLFDYMKETKNLLGSAATAAKNTTKNVNTEPVRQKILDAIKTLESKPEFDPIDERNALRLKSIYNDVFGLVFPEAPNIQELPGGQKLLSELDLIIANQPKVAPANFSFVDKNLPQKATVFRELDPGQEQFLLDINKFARGTADKDKEILTNEAGDLAKLFSSKQSANRDAAIREKLAKIAELQKKYTRTEKKNIQPGDIANDIYHKLTGYSESFVEPNTGKVNALNRPIERPVNSALAELNNQFNIASGGVTEATNKAYNKFTSRLGPYETIMQNITTKGVLDPQKTYQTFVRLGSPSKRNILGQIEQLNKTNVLDLQEPNQLRALNAFYGPSEDSFLIGAGEKAPQASKIMTALGALGSLAGYKLGGGYTGAAIGGGAGVFGGQGLSSKPAARAYINLGQAIDKMSQSAPFNSYFNITRPAYNPWLYQENQP